MNDSDIIAIGLFVVLLYTHMVREAFHAEGRRYLRSLIEGTGIREDTLFSSPRAQVRAAWALRFARLLALVAWTLAIARVLAPAGDFRVFWGEGITAGVGGDLACRLVADWLTARSSRGRLLLLRHAYGLTLLFSPLAWLYRVVASQGLGLNPVRDTMLALEEEQVIIITHQGEVQPMQAAEKTLIDNIFDFRETIVREIMVPRLDIIAVPVDTTVKEALDVIIKHGHSRIPVYEGTIDRIVGILYAKDVLRYMRESYPDWPQRALRSMLRPPYYIPDSKRVSDLLPEMQQNKIHMAIVVDEYGGTAGIVTIEDVLEEIVGEIQDEYDRETPEMQRVDEGEFVINARADLEDVSDFIGVRLPDKMADTLGGFIYTLLNRMPRVGDVVEYPPVHMQVLSVDGRRIGLVRVSVSREKEAETSSPPPAGVI